MKTLLIILSLILLFTLNAQNYTFVRGTFNAAGGTMQNSQFQAVTAVAEDDQGSSATANYSGYLGFLFPLLDQSPPVITSIDDVPNDQGRKVQIVWNKCAFDDVYNQEAFYSIWRNDEDFGGRKGLDAGNSNHKLKTNQKAVSQIYSEPWQVVEQFRINPNQTYFWENGREVWTFIDEVPALQNDQYSYIAETLSDSSASGTNEATFKVVFHDEFAYYESESAGGYSTDDIAPDAASNVTIAVNQSFRNSTITLSWDEVEYGTYQGNSYPEINGIWYKIYSAEIPDFDCNEESYLTIVTDPEYVFTLNNEEIQFFKIVVSDRQ
ncbi:MAG: hypothetical protein H8E57_01815 [Candidatus Cloacimonetes bacterium]|nr:hypothetical protein [Candidatus Cloacimonadota bacterium]